MKDMSEQVRNDFIKEARERLQAHMAREEEERARREAEEEAFLEEEEKERREASEKASAEDAATDAEAKAKVDAEEATHNFCKRSYPG